MYSFEFFFSSARRWFCLLSLVAFVCVDTVEFIQTDSDFGELHLVKNVTGEWSILYIEKGLYFKRDSSPNFCVGALDYYGRCTGSREFFPTTLEVQRCSENIFPTGLFQEWFFKRLQRLQMSNVQITEFQREGLLGAEALDSLTLSHNKLMEIPSMAFSSAWKLTAIDLSHNQIASMASDVFKTENIEKTAQGSTTTEGALKHLESIHLHHNALTHIDPEWFLNLVKLKTLKLYDNLLTEINACSAFSTNIALRTLDLRNNEFSVIKTNGLSDNQCLNQLDSFDISNNLNYNGSQMIRVNAATIDIRNTNARECFVPYNAIILRADHNRIETVAVDELPNILEELQLSYNKINSTDFLFDLEHLHIIDLSHNELTEVNGKEFENMPNLTTLNIAFNRIVTIDLTFLKSIGKLTHLDISNNFLSGSFKLHVEAVGLSVLNISGNNFTSVQHNLRVLMPNLTSIDLNENNYDCEDLASIILFLNLDHITPVVRNDGDFGSTDNVRGIKCHHINEEEVASDSTKSTYKVTKAQIIKTIDEKFVKLESKLIDLINVNNVAENQIES